MGRIHIGWIGLVCLAGFLGLGSLWVVDRTRRWETPRLDSAFFTVLRDLPWTGPTRDGVDLVAVNLRCPHCLRTLRRLQAEGAEGRAQELVVLLVDQGDAPPRSALESLEAGRVWWDRRGIWRHRWGHRVYGEVLRFDRAGRYLRTTPPQGGSRSSIEPLGDARSSKPPIGERGGDAG